MEKNSNPERVEQQSLTLSGLASSFIYNPLVSPTVIHVQALRALVENIKQA